MFNLGCAADSMQRVNISSGSLLSVAMPIKRGTIGTVFFNVLAHRLASSWGTKNNTLLKNFPFPSHVLALVPRAGAKGAPGTGNERAQRSSNLLLEHFRTLPVVVVLNFPKG